MKRSRINQVIKDMEALIREHRFEIPPFCGWTPEDWAEKGPECDEIRDNMLGWDITDYGLGKFDQVGFALITIRNGNLKNPVYKKPYAEKLLMLYPGQTVVTDGVKRTVPAGTKIKLAPGESITITQYLYHDFQVPKEGGSVLLGEVSMCNDDENDNRFYEPIGRFPKIEEDEKPYRYLCTEYPKA